MNPITLLRLEGLAALAAAAICYRELGFGWWLFGGLFLVPDVFMLGYLAGQKIGAVSYNLGHTYVLALSLGLFCWLIGNRTGVAVSLIWVAHIGFDRFFGYGLKYASGFKHTHLGALYTGKAPVSPG